MRLSHELLRAPLVLAPIDAPLAPSHRRIDQKVGGFRKIRQSQSVGSESQDSVPFGGSVGELPAAAAIRKASEAPALLCLAGTVR